MWRNRIWLNKHDQTVFGVTGVTIHDVTIWHNRGHGCVRLCVGVYLRLTMLNWGYMSRTKLGLGLGLGLEMHKTINHRASRTLPKAAAKSP